MKHQIFIVTALLGNMAFGAVIPVGALRVNTQIRQLDSTTTLASMHLYKKGLEKQIASMKVKKILADNEALSDLMSRNIIHGIKGVSQADVVHYISNAALFDKPIDLGSYATLISLAQTSLNRPLSKGLRQKVEAVAVQNKNLRSTFMRVG